MKYLKLYENYKKVTKEDILSCFRDIEDIGYNVNWNNYCITIRKTNHNNLDNSLDYLYDFNEIKETLLFAIPYIEDVYKLFIDNIYIDNSIYGLYPNNFNTINDVYRYFENNSTIIEIIKIRYKKENTLENFNIDSNAGDDNNQSLNPALKKEVEEYVNDLIEKDYKKLLNMLGIKKYGREIDVDELKEKAIKYFLEVPDRMRKLNIPFNSNPMQTNIIPKTNNIGGCLRERL